MYYNVKEIVFTDEDVMQEKIWSKTTVLGDDDCWEWNGAKNMSGYGIMRKNGRQVKVHRIVAEEYYPKEFAKAECVRHLCNNKSCVNPKHLRPGTHKENMEDTARAGIRKGELNGNSKLTNQQRNEIYNSDLSTSELCDMYNIGPKAIRGIKNNPLWGAV